MDADLDVAHLDMDYRMRRFWPVAEACLARVYGSRPDFDAWLQCISRVVRSLAAARSPELCLRDGGSAGWWREGAAIGYSAYVDRLAGDLRGLQTRIPYLKELGVSYLHLLPLFKARDGENDGGFAVSDFDAVDARLGTMADLQDLAMTARKTGVRLVLDLVCNHTADDHAWALAARSGDPEYRDYYHVLPDPEAVRRCEERLVDVFPDVAPGNFTYTPEMGGWVWTTFYPFQWDLNYANPAVFCEMTATMLRLANRGVDGLRLDSAPFLWKRPGTDCRNQPEVHWLLAAWRALLSIGAPGVVLKAEAIERLDEVKTYFGAQAAEPECHLAYNNGVMTGLWACLALGSAEPARSLIEAASRKPSWGTWVNYVRCHDDIIWSALSPHVPVADQARCSSFFAGDASGSFAAGTAFQGVAGVPPSTNGMAAALVGLAGDEAGAPAANRLLLLYGVTYALDGFPVVWMGDEIGLGDSADAVSEGAALRDGRWLQRPFMDWTRADRRTDAGTLPGRIFQQLAAYGRMRAERPAFGAEHVARPVASTDPAVLSFRRGDGADAIQCVANFSNDRRASRLELEGAGGWVDLLSDDAGETPDVELGPYQVRWLMARG
jgi:amylosucrase